MASKKSKVDNGEIRFDTDLDFNFDDSFDTFDISKSKKKRKPIHDVMRGVGHAAKSKLKSGSFWNELAKKALPKSYTEISDEFDKVRETVSDTYRESVRTLKPELSRIGRQVDQLVPEEAKRIKRFTSRFKDPMELSSNPSAEELQNQSIMQGQAAIFGNMSDRADAKEARDRAEQRIKDKIDAKRFSTNVNILGNIQTNLSRMTSYTTTVNASWQKKSLELQYRSYYVQAETLKTMNKYNDLFKTYFEAIKENTALPDFAKVTKSEMFKQMTLNKMFSGISSGVGAGIKRIGKHVNMYVRGAADRLGEMSMGLDQLGDLQSSMKMAKELGMDESLLYHGANTAGGALMDILARKAGKKLRRFFPAGGKVSKGLAGTASFLRDPTHLINKGQNSKFFKDKMAGGGKGWQLVDWLGNMMKTPAIDKTVTTGSAIGSGRDPAYFSQRAHRSLTEVIPGYLARILQETTAIRTGSKKLGDMQVFDYERGRFISGKTFRSKAISDLLKGANMSGSNWKLHEAAKLFGGKEVAGHQAKRIKDYLHTISSDVNMDYGSDQIINNPHFAKLPREDQEHIRKKVSSLYSTPEGRNLGSATMHSVRQDTDRQIKSAKKIVDDYITAYGPEQLLRANLIQQNDKGGYDVNFDRYFSMLRSKGISAKGIKPSEFKGIFGIVPRAEGAPIVKPGDPTVTGSDRNIKRSIRSAGGKVLDKLRKLGTYKFNYRGWSGRNDGQQHQSYMAQEVKKAFGEHAAPGGVKVDLAYMTSMNTEAIKELAGKHGGGLGDASSLHVLLSIDRRLAEMSSITKMSHGVSPESGDSKTLFGDTVNLAKRYAKAGVHHGKNFAGQAHQLGKGVAGFGKSMYDQHKDTVKSGISRLVEDALSLTGLAYNTAKGVATTVIPNAIQAVRDLGKKAAAKTREWLQQPRDFYIPGMKEPIIVGELFKKGFYFDEHGKPIINVEQLKKMTGSLYNRAGEVVVSASQFADGLFDRHGNKLQHLLTSLRGIGVHAAGWAASKLMEGASRLKNAGGAVFDSFRKGNFLTRALGGVGAAAGGALGKLNPFGFGAKINSTLQQMLGIMKKWDGQHGPTGIGPGTVGGFMGPPSTLMNTPSYNSSGFAGLASAAKLKQMYTRVAGTNIGQKGVAAGKGFFQGGMNRIRGRFGGGRLGKLGGKLGAVGGMLGGLFGQRAAAGAGVDHEHHDNFVGPPQNPQIRNVMTGKPIPQAGATNNRRAGDQFTRLDELRAADANRVRASVAHVDAPRYMNDDGGGGLMGLLKNFTGFLGSSVTGLFNLTKGALGGLMSVGGGLLKSVGFLGKGAGAVARGAGGLLGRIGGPLVSTVGRIGASTVGRAVAGMAARTAILSGAASIATGGLTSMAFGAVSAGIAGLGAILASPVALGALAVGGLAYGGYKAYQYMTRDDLDDFQKIRFTQYGFGTANTKFNHNVANLEHYLLDGKIGYKNQESGPGNATAYLLEKRMDPKDVLATFDVDPDDQEASKMFVDWFQYRFKPFFLTWCTALHNTNPKLALPSAMKLKNEEKIKFLNACRASDSRGWEYQQPPVKNIDSLGNTKSEVMKMIDDQIKGLDKDAKKDGKDGKGKDGKDKPKTFFDRVKSGMLNLIPGVAAARAVGDWLGKTKIGAAVKEAGSKAIDSVMTSAEATGRKMLKYLQDKNIPAAAKQTLLNFGSSMIASLPKVGNLLLKAAMVMPGVKLASNLLNNTRAGQAVKKVAGAAGTAIKSAAAKVWDKAKTVGTAVAASVSAAASWAGSKLSAAGGAVSGAYNKAVDVTSRGIESASKFISSNYDKLLGFVSSKYESGRRGVATISSGNGDAGGVSYGRFQLASKNGSMSAFLASPEGSKFMGQFSGLKPGSPEFNAKYVEVVKADAEGFDKAQHDYITRTHYQAAYDKLNKAIPALGLSKRGRAVQEAIFSTSVQYGPGSTVLIDALKDKEVSKMSDEQIVSAIQDYKSGTVNTRFKSSSGAVQASVSQRIQNEKMDLIAMARMGGGGKTPAAANDSSFNQSVAAKTAAGSGSPMAGQSLSANQSASAAPTGAGASASAVPMAIAATAGTATKAEAKPVSFNPTAGDPGSKPDGGYKKMSKEIAAATPSYVSNKTSDDRQDSGESPFKELITASGMNLNIQKQQLDTMMKMQVDIASIADFLINKGKKLESVPVEQPKPKAEPMRPLVDIGRVRSM